MTTKRIRKYKRKPLIRPHSLFSVTRPDEVAETWSAVPPALYSALWECTHHYEPIDFEDCGPHDVIGINCVTNFWSSFSAEHKVLLNKLAIQEANQWR